MHVYTILIKLLLKKGFFLCTVRPVQQYRWNGEKGNSRIKNGGDNQTLQCPLIYKFALMRTRIRLIRFILNEHYYYYKPMLSHCRAYPLKMSLAHPAISRACRALFVIVFVAVITEKWSTISNT